MLGLTTVLVPAEAQGAVLGTTAVLDASDLIRGEDFGAPLFEETAHRLRVRLHRAQAGRLDEVRAVIESEKPAHVAYDVCLIEPRFRLGFQARLGIDAVVGGPPPAGRLGDEAGGLVLAGESPARLGEAVRIGQTARLGPAAPPRIHEGQGGSSPSAHWSS